MNRRCGLLPAVFDPLLRVDGRRWGMRARMRGEAVGSSTCTSTTASAAPSTTHRKGDLGAKCK
jgi:hypothetical protein